MANRWCRVEIENLLDEEVLYIGDGYRAKREELAETGLPFARAGNIDHGFQFEDADRFPEEDLYKVGEKASQVGDVLFTSKGTVGRYALVREDTEPFVYSPQLSFWRVLDAQVIEPRFLFYWMHGKEFRYQLYGVKGQTDMADYVSLRDQRRMYLTLPPMSEQQAIAKVLGSLDDKIDLNRRMNATLEAIARAIFTSWFVDFDPVHSKTRGETPAGMDAATAALFPDAFVESELGPIPAGWRVGVLGDIAKNVRRNVDPDELPGDTPYIGLGHMPQQSLALTEWGESRDVGSTKREFGKSEILFGKLRPYFHKVGIAPVDGICSTDMVVVVPKQPMWYGFSLFHLSSDEFIDYTMAVATGTRMPRTKWRDMAKYKVVIPSKDVAIAFNQVVASMFKKILSNIHESQTLAALRDTLLPKLISGELSVS